MGMALESDRRYHEAYEIGKRLFLHTDQVRRNAGFIYMSVATQNLPVREEPLGDNLLRQYKDRLVLELEQDLPVRAGTAAYNLGMLHNTRGELEVALDCYAKAAVYDPGYSERDYFFRERGGMLWDRGRYLEAANDYKKALDLGAEKTELLPLLADAYLYGGKYAQAGAVLRAWTYTGARLDRLVTIVTLVSQLLTEYLSN